MRQSQLFSKTRREAPKDEVSKNAQLLIRAGYIHKDMAGVYSLLPLGLRVMEKIVGIIRGEMNGIGGQELHLASLQNPELWKKTDRWEDRKVDIWFKTRLKNDTELGLGFTHEETITNLMRDHVRSFRDLPIFAYQFQTKFRNETRAKSGIIRSREFLMKDLYSFCRNPKEHESFYEKAKEAYENIFRRVGIGASTFLTYASGGSFAKYSHEFQTLSDAGEDTIHICERCKIAINDEILADMSVCPLCKSPKFRKGTSVEVGNIFSLGTRYSAALGLTYIDEAGKSQPVVMGSYGVGPGRLMGTIVELLSDDKGLVWPEEVAPFKVHLLSLSGKDEGVSAYADALYQNLTEGGIEVLYDDREVPTGEKFSDADLLGLPYRLVVSKKTMEKQEVELKVRSKGEVKFLKEKEVLSGSFLKS